MTAISQISIWAQDGAPRRRLRSGQNCCTFNNLCLSHVCERLKNNFLAHEFASWFKPNCCTYNSFGLNHEASVATKLFCERSGSGKKTVVRTTVLACAPSLALAACAQRTNFQIADTPKLLYVQQFGPEFCPRALAKVCLNWISELQFGPDLACKHLRNFA